MNSFQSLLDKYKNPQFRLMSAKQLAEIQDVSKLSKARIGLTVGFVAKVQMLKGIFHHSDLYAVT